MDFKSGVLNTKDIRAVNKIPVPQLL